MLRAAVAEGSSRLAERLARKARTLAEAHAETRLRARRSDASRWRSARLLWPLFTKGN